MRKNTLARYENLVCMTLEDEQIFQKITSDPIYDQMNRVTSQTDPANATTAYTYDQNGNQLSMTNALNNTWTMQFDAKDRMIIQKYPLTPSDNGIQREARMEFNKNDELITSISPLGRITRYSYDNRGQKKIIMDPLSGAITYNYDINQNLISLSDQRNNTITWVYDELYRITQMIDSQGKITRVSYDPDGNVISVLDRLNRISLASYDELNRLANIQYTDATVTYQYDVAGRRTRVTDTQFGVTFIAWTYDAANRLLSETTSQGTVNYTYNQANQRILMQAGNYPSVNYTYDGSGRLASISQTLGQNTEIFTYSYDLLSRPRSLQRPNSISTIYDYDQNNRLARLTHQKSGNPPIEDFQYTYNADSEINSILSLFSVPVLNTNTTINSSDNTNRINQFGNINYTFNDAGEITGQNIPDQGTIFYQWDHRGRLTKATLQNGQEVTYNYDPIGRRIKSSFNGSVTNFVYDRENVIEDIKNGNSTYYLNSLFIDDKLRLSDSSLGQLYFLTDHIKSVVALTTHDSAIFERKKYSCYGLSLDSSITRYAYTGREQDEITGLIYYRARWYDPIQGRFIGEDPIGLVGGSNLYLYTNNNYINFTDPFGLVPMGRNGGTFCNQTSKCIIASTDLRENGPGNEIDYVVVKPGECTNADIDYDYAYIKGRWFKCRNYNTCYFSAESGDITYTYERKTGLPLKYKIALAIFAGATEIPFNQSFNQGGDYLPTQDFPISEQKCKEYCECNKTPNTIGCDTCKQKCKRKYTQVDSFGQRLRD